MSISEPVFDSLGDGYKQAAKEVGFDILDSEPRASTDFVSNIVLNIDFNY